MKSMFSFFWTILSQLFCNLVVPSFIIISDVIRAITFSAVPCTILTFALCHNVLCQNLSKGILYEKAELSNKYGVFKKTPCVAANTQLECPAEIDRRSEKSS
jgi:hypothetical protein